jgi:hypothetical protein
MLYYGADKTGSLAQAFSQATTIQNAKKTDATAHASATIATISVSSALGTSNPSVPRPPTYKSYSKCGQQATASKSRHLQDLPIWSDPGPDTTDDGYTIYWDGDLFYLS